MISKIIATLSFLLATALILTPNYAEAECNICQNNIACINETSFNMCYDGKPDKSMVITCPDEKVCNNEYGLKCIEKENGGSCSPDEGCGVCNDHKAFACTSRTTFAQCVGDKMSNIVGTCPKGLICDSSEGEICKNECNAPKTPECDRESPL